MSKDMQRASQELENSLTVLYNCLCKIILFMFKNMYLGIRVLWEKRSLTILILTALITVITVFIHLTYNRIYISIIPVLSYVFTAGIIKNFLLLLNKNRSNVFRKIKFHDKNGHYPKIISSKKYKKNREVVICKSFIPFKDWVNNQDLLQTAFNSKLKIIKSNNQIVKLIKVRG